MYYPSRFSVPHNCPSFPCFMLGKQASKPIIEFCVRDMTTTRHLLPPVIRINWGSWMESRGRTNRIISSLFQMDDVLQLLSCMLDRRMVFVGLELRMNGTVHSRKDSRGVVTSMCFPLPPLLSCFGMFCIPKKE